MPEQYQFLSLNVRIADKQEILQAISTATSAHPVRIATLNPEIALEAAANARFATTINHTPLCSLDGFGLSLMLRAWQAFTHRQPPPPTYRGADLVVDLFQQYSDGSKRFYLLGGKSEMQNSEATITIQKIYPKLCIVGHERGGLLDAQSILIDPDLAQRIQQSNPDIVLVGFGAPKQELWMEEFTKLHTIPVMIGVGGSLDFYAHKRRAPQWVRNVNLEWLYRGLTEPGHIRRLWRAVAVFSIVSILWMIRHCRDSFKRRN